MNDFDCFLVNDKVKSEYNKYRSKMWLHFTFVFIAVVGFTACSRYSSHLVPLIGMAINALSFIINGYSAVEFKLKAEDIKKNNKITNSNSEISSSSVKTLESLKFFNVEK